MLEGRDKGPTVATLKSMVSCKPRSCRNPASDQATVAVDRGGSKGVATKPIASLGRTYVFMVLAALVAISIDQTVMGTLTSTARIALDGTIGAALGLTVLKLLGFARRSP